MIEDEIAENPCYLGCTLLCDFGAHYAFDNFATVVAACCGPLAPVCFGTVLIICYAGGKHLCHIICNCICYGIGCGGAPGCEEYPPCICDPYEDCD